MVLLLWLRHLLVTLLTAIVFKAERVPLTMVPKTHFTQNVTCSLFCRSAPQLYLPSVYLLMTEV